MPDDSILQAADAGYVQYEGAAGAAVSPGELVELDANGDYIPHGTANAEAFGYVAFEYELTGLGIEDDYADGDDMLVRKFMPGSRVQMYLPSGLTIDPGTALTSNGDGSLQAYVTADADVGAIVAYAPPEGIDTTGEAEATLQDVIVA